MTWARCLSWFCVCGQGAGMGGAALSPSASTAEVEKFGCLDCPEACRRIKPHCLTIIPSPLSHLVIKEADEVSGVNSLLLEMESEG